MGSDGFVSVYSLPELKLIFKEDCVDASDAFGQRNFCLTPHGLFIHLRSPSEFTRGSLSEQARMNLCFSLPSKYTNKSVLTPSSPKPSIDDPVRDVSVVSLVCCELSISSYFLIYSTCKKCGYESTH